MPLATHPAHPRFRRRREFQLDLAVDDLEATATALAGLGATKPDDQPGADRWIVLLDPSGHPFCLTQGGNW